MPEKRTIILNSLLTLILIASLYQFIKSDRLTSQVGSIDRSMQRAQQQIGDLKEAASATFEQTMRRFDDFGRQVSRIAPASKNSGPRNVAAAQPKPELKNTPTGSRTRPTKSSVVRPNLQGSQPPQPVCDLPCYGRMLLPLLSQIVESTGYKVVKDQGAASGVAPSINAASQPAQAPYDQRRQQETKLNRDVLEFLQMRARVCDIGSAGNAAEDRTARCNESTRQLAEQGNSAAQKWLGTEARDKQHDLQVSITWFELAANQGDTDCMDSLGSIYAGGDRQANQTVADALADPMKALYWYSKAASLGDANAMGAIAGIYQEGRLTAQNQGEALLWYEMAAKAVTSLSKDRIASANFAGVLGDIYYNGTGVEQDKMQAYKWYAIACADTARLNTTGDSSCVSRNNVASELNPLDIAKAQTLAAEWEKLHRYSLGSR